MSTAVEIMSATWQAPGVNPEIIPGEFPSAFPKEKATKHMLEVHQQGKSCVASETRERAEFYHQQLQAHGLSVTIEQQS